MNTNVICRIGPNTDISKDLSAANFVQEILVQTKDVTKLHEHEIQTTAENPRIREANETTDISTELKALRHDEVVQQKRRQQLRTNNHELRQLEIQIRAATNNAELSKQRQSLDDVKKQREIDKRKENEEYEKERIRYLESQLEKEKAEHLKKSQLRGQLLNQINEMRQMRKEKYVEVMRDRENMQNVLKKYDQERELELKEIARRKEETKEVMEAFLEEAAENKKKQLLLSRSDDAAFIKLLEEQENQRIRIKEARHEEQAKYAEISEKIGQRLYKSESERRKRENLLLDLLVEERNANEDMRYRIELEKRNEQRLQMRRELERYLSDMEQLRSTEKEDEYWLKESKKILAQKDKEEQLKAEAKHKKTLEYQTSLLQLIEERRIQRTMTAAEERELYQLLNKEQIAL